MTISAKRKRLTFFMYLLMGYTILQFFWWTYLIFELNAEIISLEQQILHIAPQSELAQKIALTGDLHETLHKKKLMVIGESSVFLLILLAGFYLIKRSLDKEASLARKETNFLLSVTHELNTPLASIHLNLETLKRKDLSENQREHLLQTTSEASNRLQHIVNNILTASRMEAKGYSVNTSNIDLAEHMTGFMAKIESLYPQKFSLAINTGTRHSFDIDVIALDTILGNLVENASKYSPAGSEIDIIISHRNNRLIIEVTDRGIGIPEAEHDRIFEKFYRIGSEKTRTTKGTGLGLYLVKKLIDALHGSISFRSAENRGTVFTVEIPV